MESIEGSHVELFQKLPYYAKVVLANNEGSVITLQCDVHTGGGSPLHLSRWSSPNLGWRILGATIASLRKDRGDKRLTATVVGEGSGGDGDGKGEVGGDLG